MRSSSSTLACGMAKRSFSTDTISDGMMASVSGSLMRNGRALADSEMDLDLAAEAVEVGLDHVHADAAAGDIGDLLGGRDSPGRKIEGAACPASDRPRPFRR